MEEKMAEYYNYWVTTTSIGNIKIIYNIIKNKKQCQKNTYHYMNI